MGGRECDKRHVGEKQQIEARDHNQIIGWLAEAVEQRERAVHRAVLRGNLVEFRVRWFVLTCRWLVQMVEDVTYLLRPRMNNHADTTTRLPICQHYMLP